MTQQGASLEEVANRLQQNAQDEAQGAELARETGGVLVAPGVRFSDRLWSRLGGKTRDLEKQKRRERMTDVTAFPEVPTSLFGPAFKRDAIWKQRELRLRKGYVEHLENLTLKKDDEKEALQAKLLEQVTGVYKLAEEEAINRLSAHTQDLEKRSYRPAKTETACSLEKDAAIKCYKQNGSNPLGCAVLVSAFEKCANRARGEAIRASLGS
mmetsp:Transcript_5461/g.8687  ORF Transcript_5461/g.8687 Transcript_5461/m.8687 type:complete len:211 (-) Transcript_5461:216-848(-)